MRIARRIMIIIVAGVAMLLALAPPVFATGGQLPPTIVVNPNVGPVGSNFTARWSNFPTQGCQYMEFRWDQRVIAVFGPYSAGTLSTNVPSGSSPGTHYIHATCVGRQDSARAPFKVTDGSPSPTASTKPPTRTTNPPAPTTTKPPNATPSSEDDKPTTTTSTTTSTTTPPSSTSSSGPPSTSEIPSSVVPSEVDEPIVSDGALELDRRSIRPGESLSAKGKGCEANRAVLISSGGSKVGATMADAKGEFVAKIDFVKIEPGRHIVVAECGIVLTGKVDQIVTSSTGGGSSAVIVLVVFVLAGAALIRFT
ncbi:MAG: hypothetical protein M3548_04785 [Actinomycetota bacterium]|nr:hypothetical protein [Actinomycetota bacterium]